jgi:acetoacetyl-CoA synthetase
MDVMFSPDAAAIACTQLTDFIRFCAARTGQEFAGYRDFEAFAITRYPAFWRLFLCWSRLLPETELDPPSVGESCEGARFFPAARISYADMLLLGAPDRPAIIACSGDGCTRRLSRGELRGKVAQLAESLGGLGVREGDRVVAIARNNAEVAIAALAATALGAAFSACGTDMGASAILARFSPLEPVVLFGDLRSEPWEHGVPVGVRLAEVAAGLPSLAAIVALDDGFLPAQPPRPMYRFAELTAGTAEAEGAWRRFPFDHPLFIMFTSGTTGRPKCIMHGAGGTLLEHLKEHRLHCDLGPGDRLFYQTSPGWMMWNWQLSALASGVELVLYDGPLRGPETMWQIVAEQRVTVFGTSATYLQYCESRRISPGSTFDLEALRSVLSTGSILYPRQYDWVREQVKILPLQSISGGTDMIGCFVLGNPNLPVHRGQAQCRSLGLDVRVLPPPSDPAAAIGELICANPFPSRPVGFYGDPGGRRYHDAYFSQNPGVWTHGDLIEITSQGGAVMHGRCDGVLNIQGVRLGPAEIYAILQDIAEIFEAMAIEQAAPEEPGGARLVLLVVLHGDAVLDADLVARIRSTLLTRGSAALVPARIAQVDALPVTHNGKRSEAAARDVVNGRAVRNREALQNPECLDVIANHPALRDPVPPEEPQSGSGPLEAVLEADLQRLCEAVLGVPSVRPSDNLFQLAGNSILALTLFMRIEERLQRRLPLEALVATPTIEGLASAIRRKEPAADSSAPRTRPVAPADVDAICTFLQGVFARSRITAAGWRVLFGNNWLKERPDLGYVLMVGERIVGFLGTVYAMREINGKSGLVCNLSSWYVLPEYRGWGMALLAAAMRDRSITYTALTPGPVTWQVLENLGFTRLDTRKLFFPPGAHVDSLLGPRPRIDLNPDTIRRSLNEAQRRIHDDHVRYDCLQLAARDAKGHLYLVVKRRVVERDTLFRLFSVRARIPVSEVIYCSAPEFLARHLERIKLAVLWRQRTLGLVVDERLFRVLPRGLPIKEHTLYRSPLFASDDMDRLYSELVLLPI